MNAIITTLGFVSAETFESCMIHLYEGKFLSLGCPHYFLYQHFPLKKERCKNKQKEICDRYGIIWVDSGYDRGLHEGMNYLVSVINPTDDTVIIGFDPYEWPTTPGFDVALTEVLSAEDNQDIVLAALKNNYNQNGFWISRYYPGKIGNHDIMITNAGVCPMSISAFKTSWFKQIGGWKQSSTHYGHLEEYIRDKLKETGKLSCVLHNYSCINVEGAPEYKTPLINFHPQDSLYKEYKQCQADYSSKEAFEVWLQKRGINYL